jgi:hypothetical protein
MTSGAQPIRLTAASKALREESVALDTSQMHFRERPLPVMGAQQTLRGRGEDKVPVIVGHVAGGVHSDRG